MPNLPSAPPLAIIDAEDATQPAGRRSRVWFWALSVAVLAAVGFGATKLDWPAVVAALSHTDPAWFVAACVAFMSLPVLMAAEWRLIAARAPTEGGDMRTLLPLGCFCYFLQTYLNAALAYGTALVRLVRVRGWTIGQGIGLVTVDQLAEGISRLMFCGTVLWLAAGRAAASLWVVGAVCGFGLGLVWITVRHGRAWLRRSVSRLLRRLSPWGHTADVLDEVGSILQLRSFAWGIALATTKKVAKISAAVAIERALGLSNSPWTAVYFVAMLECATTLPLVPGNLGVIESTAVGVYASQGFSAEAGLSVGLLYRAGIHLATAVMATAAALVKGVGGLAKVPAESDAADAPVVLVAAEVCAAAEAEACTAAEAEVRPTAA
jgi:uncharacterized membrane protein YbhN (UPF0104 family)